jgi:DNA mismatch repair protein MSH6
MHAGNVSVDAVHLMALQEAPCGGAGAGQEARVAYGFAFLDAAAGRFYVGAAEDDAGRSTLGALLMQARPLAASLPMP